MSLVDLQVAIDAGNTEDIRAFYEACDVLSGNEKLLDRGREHGFPTALMSATPHPKRFMLARDLARVMQNRTDVSSLRNLLNRHGLEFFSIGAFVHDEQKLIRAEFNLDPYDGRSTFATWEHYLHIAMHGQTEQAKKERAYLLQAETRERVRAKVREATGMQPEDLEAALQGPATDPVLQQLEILRQQHLRTLALEQGHQRLAAGQEAANQRQDAIEEENEALKQRLAQAEAELQATRAEAVQATQRLDNKLARVSSTADKALNAAQDDVTLEMFVRTRNLYHQLPPAYWKKVYPDWLKDYSRHNNLLVDSTRVSGKRWPTENTYKLQALYALQRAVMHEPEQFDLALHDERSA